MNHHSNLLLKKKQDNEKFIVYCIYCILYLLLLYIVFIVLSEYCIYFKSLDRK